MNTDLTNIELKFSGLDAPDTKPYDPIEQALIDGLASDRVDGGNSSSSLEVSDMIQLWQ